MSVFEKDIIRLGKILLEGKVFNKEKLNDADKKNIEKKFHPGKESSVNFRFESLDKSKNIICVMCNIAGEKNLIVYSRDEKTKKQFSGKYLKQKGISIIICQYEHSNTDLLRKSFSYTAPKVLKEGFIFGAGYRPSWGLGNAIQARVAKELGINVVLAQQSAREIERTGRSFEEVVDRGTWSAFDAHLTAPWSADGDHLRTEQELKGAAGAGCTHFTYDVSEELKKGLKEVVEKIVDLHHLTGEIKRGDFSTEISLDETAHTTKLDELTYILEELKKRKIKIDEIAPRFPGYFEKAIDYYFEKYGKNSNLTEFGDYLKEIIKILKRFGYRLSVHSGSDKFSIYPILSKNARDMLHLKTAGTYYLEELKIVALYNTDLFKEIFAFALKRFQKDRATYELTTDLSAVSDISKIGGEEISALLDASSGNKDLRQVMHVTYGSVLSDRRFFNECFYVLKSHPDEHFQILGSHMKKHLEFFV